ncbi:hypothetical protein HYX16_03060 [Candidatus Woesearchaeota archaeon]|nr:hypothetical protein [Candidatus Woesearchaeota archaeon]
MVSYIDIMKEALNDPQIKGITCLRGKEKDKIDRAIKEHPGAEYISEWRYELVDIKYKYHMHDRSLGQELEKLLRDGKTSRHPTLIKVYKISQIESMLADPFISSSL